MTDFEKYIQYTSFFLADGYQPSNGAINSDILEVLKELILNSKTLIRELNRNIHIFGDDFKYWEDRYGNAITLSGDINSYFGYNKFIFTNTGYEKHSIGMLVEKINEHIFKFYLYNVGAFSLDKKTFIFDEKNHELIEAILCFEVNISVPLEKQLFYQLLVGLSVGKDEENMKRKCLQDDYKGIYYAYQTVIEKLIKINCRRTDLGFTSDDINIFLMDKHLVIKENKIYLDGQISGTCTFHSNLILFIHYNLLNNSKDFVSNLDDFLLNSAIYLLEKLKNIDVFQNIKNSYLNFYFSLCKKVKFIRNYKPPREFIILSKLTDYLKENIREETYYLKEYIKEKSKINLSFISIKKRQHDYPEKNFFRFFINNSIDFKNKFLIESINLKLLYFLYLTEDKYSEAFDYTEDIFNEFIYNLIPVINFSSFFFEDIKSLLSVLITFAFYLKNKDLKLFSYKLNSNISELFNYYYIYFSNQEAFKKIKILAYFKSYMEIESIDAKTSLRPFDLKEYLPNDKIDQNIVKLNPKIFNINTDTLLLNNKPFSYTVRELLLQFSILHKTDFTKKLIGLNHYLHQNREYYLLAVSDVVTRYPNYPLQYLSIVKKNILEELINENKDFIKNINDDELIDRVLSINYTVNFVPLFFNNDIKIEHPDFINKLLVENFYNNHKNKFNNNVKKRLQQIYQIDTDYVKENTIDELIFSFNNNNFKEIKEKYKIKETFSKFKIIGENLYEVNDGYIILNTVNYTYYYLKEFYEIENLNIPLSDNNIVQRLKLIFSYVLIFKNKSEEKFFLYFDGHLLLIKNDKLFLINNHQEIELKTNYEMIDKIFYNYYNLFISTKNEYFLLRVNKEPSNKDSKNIYHYKENTNSINTNQFKKIVEINFSIDQTRILNMDKNDLLMIWHSSMMAGDPIISKIIFNNIVNNNNLEYFQEKYKYNCNTFLCNFFDYYFASKIEYSNYYWNIEPHPNTYNVNNFENKEIFNFFLNKPLKYEYKYLVDRLFKELNNHCEIKTEETQCKNKESLKKFLNQEKNLINREIFNLNKNLFFNYINYLFEKNKFLNFIEKNFETIKYLIEINQSYKFIISLLENQLFDTETNMVISELINMINPDNLSLDKKFNYEFLFEYLFGYIINKRQLNLVYEILNDERPEIKQLLMGQGKSSVITPLLFLNRFFNNDNIIISLPNHLLNDTYKMFFNYNILPFRLTLFNFKYNESNNLDLYQRKILKNQLIIIDSESIKYHLIKNKINKITDNLKDFYIIFDEIDNQINYLSSEFNIPSGEKENFDKKYLKTLFLIAIKFKKLFGNKEIENLTQADKNIILGKFLFEDNFNCHLNLFSLTLDKFVEYFSEIDIKKILYKITNKENFLSSITIEDYSFYKISLYYFIQSFGLIYNKDYGRSSIVSILISVPYSSVNTPMNQSQFSNIYLTIILTILSYLNGGLLLNDYINFLNEEIKNYLSSPLNNLDKKTIYHEIISYEESINLKKINENAKKLKTFYDLKNNNIKKINLIFWYFETYVFNQIKFNKSQFSSTFLNIISPYYTSRKKCGFSGSINFDLPKYSDPVNSFIEEPKQDSFSIDAVESAIIGKKLTTNLIYDDINENKTNFLKFILEKMKELKIGILIDVGALFKDYSGEEIAILIFKTFMGKRNVFFLDEDSNKLMIEKNDPKEIKIVPMKLSNYPDEIAGVFTQNKIIGIDIKLPLGCKFITTITHKSKLTEVSQGIFRARKLNQGHFLYFVYSKIYFKNNFKDTNGLYQFLIKNEENYKKNSETNKLIQYVKDVKMFKANIYEYPLFIEKLENEKQCISELKTNFLKEFICSDESISEIKLSCSKLRNLNQLQYLESEIVHDTEKEKDKEEDKEKEKEIEKEIEKEFNCNFKEISKNFQDNEKEQDNINEIFNPNENKSKNKLNKLFGENMIIEITNLGYNELDFGILDFFYEDNLTLTNFKNLIRVISVNFVEIWEKEKLLKTVICSSTQAHALAYLIKDYEKCNYYGEIKFEMFKKYTYKIFDSYGKDIYNPTKKLSNFYLINLVNLYRNPYVFYDKDIETVYLCLGQDFLKNLLPLRIIKLKILILRDDETGLELNGYYTSNNDFENNSDKILKKLIKEDHFIYDLLDGKKINLKNFINKYYGKQYNTQIYDYLIKLIPKTLNTYE